MESSGASPKLFPIRTLPPQHDQNTYLGRVLHFFQVTDLRTLFVSDEKVQEAQQTLHDFYYTNKDIPLEKAYSSQKIVDAILHPDTKDKIPLPFRMSFFTPGNILIVAGMLGATTIPATIFWQTVNQTYNVCVNYSNRNASSPMTNQDLAKSYGIALSTSVGTAVGLNEWVKRTTLFKTPQVKSLMNKLVPFTAVAVANVFNIGSMRWNEIKADGGVQVKDKDGNVLGKSAVAGKIAVAQTIFSRVILIVPAMVFHPILMEKMEANFTPLQKNAWLKTSVNLALLSIFIGLFLPLGIGIFPQQSSLSTSVLEDRFKNLKNEKGEVIDTVYYNKGL